MIISSRLQPSANQKRILRVLLSELAMEDAFFRKDLKARQKPDDQDQANRAQKRRVVQVIRRQQQHQSEIHRIPGIAIHTMSDEGRCLIWAPWMHGRSAAKAPDQTTNTQYAGHHNQ